MRNLLKPLFLFLSLILLSMSKSHGSFIVKEEFVSPPIANFDCHSSSIVETENGKLLAVWKGGPGEGLSNHEIKSNISIWQSEFDGQSWSQPKEIVHNNESVAWNPVVCKNGLDELLLFYRIGPDPRSTVSFIKRSKDKGNTWSQEEILSAGIIGPTKNRPILSKTKKLISPSSMEAGAPEDEWKTTAAWIEISEDHGYHWKKIGPLELSERKFGVIEPALFYDNQGNLRMLCRDRANRIGGKGYIWMAISKDEGEHWSEFKKTELPNPDSGFDVVDFGKGKLLLVYNHSFTDRAPLNISTSTNGGDDWSQPVLLNESGEFPSAILSTDGFVHITYAIENSNNEQRRIKHVVVDPNKIFEAK